MKLPHSLLSLLAATQCMLKDVCRAGSPAGVLEHLAGEGYKEQREHKDDWWTWLLLPILFRRYSLAIFCDPLSHCGSTVTVLTRACKSQLYVCSTG